MLTTFSGDNLPTPRVVTVSREIATLDIAGGRAVVNDEDCGAAPSCTYYADAVETGDFLRIGFGLPMEMLTDLIATQPAVVADYYATTTGLDWNDMPDSNPAAREITLLRLVSIDIMDSIIPHFDSLLGLRGKAVPVIYNPFWASQTITDFCPLEGPEHVACDVVEAAIGELEASHIARLDAEGYDLWFGYPVDIKEDAPFFSFDQHVRPHFSLFGGVVGWLSAGPSHVPEATGDAMAEAIRAMAAEVGDLPVLLHGGTTLNIHTRAAEFCEAEICVSDFKFGFEQPEAWMNAALDVFAPGQIVGFALGMSDGAHFDIRDPYEQFEQFAMNRSGETGYNAPALNVYRAQ